MEFYRVQFLKRVYLIFKCMFIYINAVELTELSWTSKSRNCETEATRRIEVIVPFSKYLLKEKKNNSQLLLG